MKSSAVSSACSLALLVVGHLLDALERLDLALDERSVATRLGDDLDRLALVLLDAQLRAVEEDRVPALLEAERDHLALGAMVEMECDRNRERPGHLGPHREEHVGADRFHGLDRGLDDERRAQLLGRGQHRLHRQVVDDVDRGDTVAFRERALDDLLGRDDRHGSYLLPAGVTLAVSSWIERGGASSSGVARPSSRTARALPSSTIRTSMTPARRRRGSRAASQPRWRRRQRCRSEEDPRSRAR